MMRLQYLDSAKDDLASIALYIEDISGRVAALDLNDSIEQRCERIADLPGTLGTDRSDLRASLRSTPHRGYIIFFRYTADAVEIINILHASRDVTTYYDEG